MRLTYRRRAGTYAPVLRLVGLALLEGALLGGLILAFAPPVPRAVLLAGLALVAAYAAVDALVWGRSDDGFGIASMLLGACQTLRAQAAWRRCASHRDATPNALDEAGFWEHLEARERGRLALEADHLFDTSYAWAT